MKIKVLSDLHLEFGPIDPGTGDVLILAGDICTAESFVRDSEVSLKKRYLEFFEKCVAGYQKVFYTLGNHEYYNYYIDEAEETLRSALPEGITLLNNQSEFYKGVHFVGSTLWASFDGGDEAVMQMCSNSMNDYNCVYDKEKSRFLKPEDTLKLHNESVEWLTKALPTLRGPVVVFTHHSPSLRSFGSGYREASARGAYATDLDSFINSNPNLRLWVHGHIHESNDYVLQDCRIVSNPRGYHGHALNEGFNPEMEIKINN